jgi:hypothetical protein
MRSKTLEPGIEVNGRTVYSIVDGFGLVSNFAVKYLESAGLPGVIDKEAWYSLEKWLNAVKSISNFFGEAAEFECGKKIPSNAEFPASVKSIESAIRAIDIAYHLNHRKGGRAMYDPETDEMAEGIGHYGSFKLPNENTIVSTCDTPFPEFFDWGILTSVAQKINPGAEVAHDDTKPCRKKGAESCTYVISWQ